MRRLVSIGQRSSSNGVSQTLMPTEFCHSEQKQSAPPTLP
jgi:hypothetical protein